MNPHRLHTLLIDRIEGKEKVSFVQASSECAKCKLPEEDLRNNYRLFFFFLTLPFFHLLAFVKPLTCLRESYYWKTRL